MLNLIGIGDEVTKSECPSPNSWNFYATFDRLCLYPKVLNSGSELFLNYTLNCVELIFKKSHRKERTELAKVVGKIDENVGISSNN